MRALVASAAVIAAFSAPAFADEVSGTVMSYQPKTNVLTLTDRSVWILPAGTVLPDNLQSGEAIRIVFESDADNGWKSFQTIERKAG